MAIMETATTERGADMSVFLHGAENVVLRFRESGEDTSADDALMWGFPTVREFRSFLKALLRFDESLGVRA